MTELGLLDVLALAVLLVVLPVLSIVQLRHLKGVEIRPMPVYASSAVMLAIMGGGCLAVGARRGGPAVLGIVALPGTATAAWTAGLTLGGLAVLLAFRAVAPLVGATEGPLLGMLLPRSAAERAAFTGLSIAAGAGEELAYRGYTISALALLVGPFWAAALSSAVFGVLHVYQGTLGIVRAAVLGGLLAWGFLASGSLWPPMLAHAALDVIAGLVLADRLMVPAGANGVPSGGRGTHGVPTSTGDRKGSEMEVDLALLADAATIDAAGKLNILGVFDRISTSSFPAQHPHMVLILRFTAGVGEIGPHKVEISLSDPRGQRVVHLNGDMQLGAGRTGVAEGLKVPHVLHLDGMVFPVPGRYAFDVRIDGEHHVTVPLHVAGPAAAEA